MDVIAKSFDGWSTNIRRRLLYATFEDGQMRKCVRANPASQTLVAFDGAGRVMGWMLLWAARGALLGNVFTNVRYRRMGVATALIETAVELFGQVSLFEWDAATCKLYRAMRKRFPGAVIVKDWHRFKARYGGEVEYAEGGR